MASVLQRRWRGPQFCHIGATWLCLLILVSGQSGANSFSEGLLSPWLLTRPKRYLLEICYIDQCISEMQAKAEFELFLG